MKYYLSAIKYYGLVVEANSEEEALNIALAKPIDEWVYEEYEVNDFVSPLEENENEA